MFYEHVVATSDVFTAAYLMAMGCAPVKTIRGKPVRWLFNDEDGRASALRDQFLTSEPVPVNAHALFDAYQAARRDTITYRQ
jgi:hypothetical protein